VCVCVCVCVCVHMYVCCECVGPLCNDLKYVVMCTCQTVHTKLFLQPNTKTFEAPHL